MFAFFVVSGETLHTINVSKVIMVRNITVNELRALSRQDHKKFLETIRSERLHLIANDGRDDSDPSIALLDAWAVVADVLTFYQERISNEGNLSTGQERISIREWTSIILKIFGLLKSNISKDPNITNTGVFLIEVLAYVGDYLSHHQDTAATNPYLPIPDKDRKKIIDLIRGRKNAES